jgi:hypothetical protein
MSQQDDRPEDAPTEWLSPALYRQLCDAVDAALYAPPDARDALLAARLGTDQRLLAEARALLASHEASPRTMVTPVSSPGGNDETYIGRPDSNATMIRRDSATVIVPGSGSRPAYDPSGTHPGADGTQEMAALSAGPPASGTATIPSPFGGFAPPAPPGQDPLAATTPGVPRAIAREPEPPAPPAPMPPPLAGRPLSRPSIPIAQPAPPPAPEPPMAAPSPGPALVRGIDLGVPTAVRSSGTSVGGLLGWIVAGLALVGCGLAVWMWMGANTARTAAETRLTQSEKRFAEVRQLGQRLAEVDRLLAVTTDPGAQPARAVLLRTWMQYLTDLQRASGGTDRELLFEVAKGYRQLAAAQGGISGRTMGDRASAAKTLQIGDRLLNYLDRNGEPDRAVLRELIATLVDLGDVYAVGKDAAASTEQYRRALAAAERLGSAGVGAAEAKQQTDLIRQRIQSGPPAPSAPGVDAAPVGSAEQP